jgi:beta-glucosidase
VDDLLANEIRPFVTLYHWDLPQALEDAGGWPNRDTVDAFARYTETVVRRLGDRVQDWITHNEPWVASWEGYGLGTHAPGRTDRRAALSTAHHLLLSHGRAVEVIRREVPDARVGISLNLTPAYPAADSEEDRAAARFADGRVNRWFLDPLFRGSYPEDMIAAFGDSLPAIQDGDLRAIAVPVDFLGINNYTRSVVRAAPDTATKSAPPEGAEVTDMGWEVYPDGLYDLLMRVYHDYAPPRIYITENGAAYPDVRRHDGSVPDPERVRYLELYLEAVARAIADGAPVGGYFVWSLLDNFEWAHGYSKRFGLVYVDYSTLERVPKESYHWYRQLIAAQRDSPVPV